MDGRYLHSLLETHLRSYQKNGRLDIRSGEEGEGKGRQGQIPSKLSHIHLFGCQVVSCGHGQDGRLSDDDDPCPEVGCSRLQLGGGA